jgi:hypothetical protein
MCRNAGRAAVTRETSPGEGQKTDLSFVVQTVARDPLVLVFALFAVTATPTHLLFRRYPIGRAMVRVVFLILLTIALASEHCRRVRARRSIGPQPDGEPAPGTVLGQLGAGLPEWA